MAVMSFILVWTLVYRAYVLLLYTCRVNKFFFVAGTETNIFHDFVYVAENHNLHKILLGSIWYSF
jgi:hypothetical protein